MANSAGGGLGLTLHQAARELEVPFAQEYEPTDRNVQVNGMNFHYLEWGDASSPTILMLHGVSQQAHSWDFVSLALSDKFHIVALDQRGHGDSDWSTDCDYSIEAQQGDIDGLVKALGFDRVYADGPLHGRPQLIRLGLPPSWYSGVPGNRRHGTGGYAWGRRPDSPVPAVARRAGHF